MFFFYYHWYCFLDLYTFHATEEDARTTYEEVLQAYENVLNRLQLDFVKGICN